MVIDLPNMNSIWSVNEHNFNDLTLHIFQLQVKNNPVYAEYVNLLDKRSNKINHYSEIPFLPISFFKTHQVVSSTFSPEKIFESSSTTGDTVSKHHVISVKDYLQNAEKIFNSNFGDLSDYDILGLLPSYLERQNSSLICMVDYLMQQAKVTDGYFLYNHANLIERLNRRNPKKIVLFGVTFALLDLAENFQSDKEFTIVETGGMKGRKRELTKLEMHKIIRKSFPNARLCSEYGMTELMSQAYAIESLRYTSPPWMKVLPRADTDPLSKSAVGQTAALNIIDLANIHSCSFIATDDLGYVYPDGSFEVKGRLDHSDIRGCSLLAL